MKYCTSRQGNRIAHHLNDAETDEMLTTTADHMVVSLLSQPTPAKKPKSLLLYEYANSGADPKASSASLLVQINQYLGMHFNAEKEDFLSFRKKNEKNA